MEKSEWIWMNGDLVPWENAKVHVLSHGLHYGSGVFEGIRCYDTDRGPAVFRHRDHLERLAKSAKLYYLPLSYPVDELRDATHELIRRNGLSSCYIRPIAFRGYGEMGLYAQSAPVDVIIAAWPWGAYLGDAGKRNGVRAKVSSWRRISPDGLIPEAKACGQYLNSILAKTESAKAGYAVTGFDLLEPARQTFAAAGGRVAGDIASAVAAADVVIMLLPNGKIVRESIYYDMVEVRRQLGPQ